VRGERRAGMGEEIKENGGKDERGREILTHQITPKYP
jgi:hypothetical protein